MRIRKMRAVVNTEFIVDMDNEEMIQEAKERFFEMLEDNLALNVSFEFVEDTSLCESDITRDEIFLDGELFAEIEG